MGPSKKRIYDFSELIKLVERDHACITVKECSRKLALHPKYVLDVKKGIKETMDLGLNKFDRSLGGILLDYRRLKILNDKNSGKVVGKLGEFQITVIAEFFVFQPEIGSILEGTVNVKSDNHIGCLVHNIINATILKPNDVEYESWNCRNIDIGSVIRFEVVDLSFYGHVPYIEGRIPGHKKKTKHVKMPNQLLSESNVQYKKDSINIVDLISCAEQNEDFLSKLSDPDFTKSPSRSKTLKTPQISKEKASKEQGSKKRKRNQTDDDSPLKTDKSPTTASPAKKKPILSLVFNSSERSLFSDSEEDVEAWVEAPCDKSSDLVCEGVNGFGGKRRGEENSSTMKKRHSKEKTHIKSRVSDKYCNDSPSPAKKKRSNRGELEVESTLAGDASPILVVKSKSLLSDAMDSSTSPSKKKRLKVKCDKSEAPDTRLSIENVALNEAFDTGKWEGKQSVNEVRIMTPERTPKVKDKIDSLKKVKKSKKDTLPEVPLSNNSGIEEFETAAASFKEKNKVQTKRFITSTPKLKKMSELSSECSAVKKIKKSERKKEGSAKKKVKDVDTDSIRKALLNEIKFNLYS